MYIWSKNGKICTFYTKNEVFAQKFDPIVQIGDKNWSLVPQNVHLVPKNGKICTFYTKNEVFKNLTHKLGIKTEVWYPKMYIWSLKMEKFVFFTLKMKCLPKNLQIGDKNWSLVPQNVHLVPKNGKICTFYTKNEVFHPKLVIKNLTQKMEKFVLFTKNEVFAQKFDPILRIGDKN